MRDFQIYKKMKVDVHLLKITRFYLIKTATHRLFTIDYIIILWNVLYQVIEPFPHVLN